MAAHLTHASLLYEKRKLGTLFVSFSGHSLSILYVRKAGTSPNLDNLDAFVTLQLSLSYFSTFRFDEKQSEETTLELRHFALKSLFTDESILWLTKIIVHRTLEHERDLTNFAAT